MNRKLKTRHVLRLAAFCTLCGGATAASFGGAFISGNDLVVARIGDGTTNYSSEAAPVYLDEYNVSGSTPVLENTVAFASSGSNSLTESYNTGGRDGYLTLSPNGQYLAFAGYRKDAGSGDPSGDLATATPRVVGIVGANGVPDTSTALTNYSSGVAFRSAVTTDGTNIYVTDNGGGTNAIAYTTLGSSSATPISVNGAAGFRSVTVAGGQLYGSTGSTPKGTFAITGIDGNTLPTSGTANQTLITRSGSSDSVSDAVFLAESGPTIDTAYLAESTSFDKFSLISGTWTFEGSIAATTGYITGVAAQQNGSSVNLFFSTDGGIYKYTDTVGDMLSGTEGTPYITPGVDENFRGIAFAAAPEPTSLSLMGIAIGGMLLGDRRRGRAKRA